MGRRLARLSRPRRGVPAPRARHAHLKRAWRSSASLGGSIGAARRKGSAEPLPWRFHWSCHAALRAVRPVLLFQECAVGGPGLRSRERARGGAASAVSLQAVSTQSAAKPPTGGRVLSVVPSTRASCSASALELGLGLGSVAAEGPGRAPAWANKNPGQDFSCDTSGAYGT